MLRLIRVLSVMTVLAVPFNVGFLRCVFCLSRIICWSTDMSSKFLDCVVVSGSQKWVDVACAGPSSSAYSLTACISTALGVAAAAAVFAQ